MTRQPIRYNVLYSRQVLCMESNLPLNAPLPYFYCQFQKELAGVLLVASGQVGMSSGPERLPSAPRH